MSKTERWEQYGETLINAICPRCHQPCNPYGTNGRQGGEKYDPDKHVMEWHSLCCDARLETAPNQ